MILFKNKFIIITCKHDSTGISFSILRLDAFITIGITSAGYTSFYKSEFRINHLNLLLQE